jgi:hypothetical protein
LNDDEPIEVVQLMPLKGELPLPELTEETNWPGVFEFRRP